MNASLNRPGIGNGYGVVFMQIALPAIVEQAECRVATLLDFGKHDPGAYGVDGAGGTKMTSPFATGRH